jgi:hypothetical protein
MSLWDSLLKTFPKTSDIYWTVFVYGLALLGLQLLVGELLAIFHVRNFTFFTYYVRYLAPRHVLVASVIGFMGLAIFVLIHFIWGHGYKVGPNV